MKFKAHVRMGQYTGGPEGGGLFIDVEDEASGVNVINIRLTRAEAGELITGGQAEGEGNVVGETGYARIGKQHEHRRILVPGLTSSTWNDRDELTRVAMKTWGLDDWIPDVESKFNFHKSNAEGYEVIVRRWV